MEYSVTICKIKALHININATFKKVIKRLGPRRGRMRILRRRKSKRSFSLRCSRCTATPGRSMQGRPRCPLGCSSRPPLPSRRAPGVEGSADLLGLWRLGGTCRRCLERFANSCRGASTMHNAKSNLV